MDKEKANKKPEAVKLIIEPADESIDFGEFVSWVLDYEMVRMGKVACFVVLERLEGNRGSKQTPS